jgi:hypothetical protein
MAIGIKSLLMEVLIMMNTDVFHDFKIDAFIARMKCRFYGIFAYLVYGMGFHRYGLSARADKIY